MPTRTLIGVAPPAPGSVTPPKSGPRLVLQLVPSEHDIDDVIAEAETARLCGDARRATVHAYAAFAMRREILRAARAGCYSIVSDMGDGADVVRMGGA